MRVAMYYNNNDVRLEEMPKPEIGPKEILVKVITSGICGSDVLEWYRIKKAPRVLGHEIAGIIEETGEEVTKYKPGQRVFVSHHIPCNTCKYCLEGEHTVCDTLHNTNYFPGGFSEYIRVPELNVDRGVFILPDEVSYEEGAFVEPLACVLRGQRVVGSRPGQSMLILGSGMSGLLHIITAKAHGAGNIIATDINGYRLNAAKKFGADTVIDASNDEIVPEIRKANDGKLADIVVICTGAQQAYSQALRSVDKGGTVLFYAAPGEGVLIPLPVSDFWRNGIKLMPTYANSPQDAVDAIDLMSSGKISVKDLITHRLSLSETGMGFKLVAEAKDCMKVLIEPQK